MFYQRFLEYAYDDFLSRTDQSSYQAKVQMVNHLRDNLDPKFERFMLHDLREMAQYLSQIKRSRFYGRVIYLIAFNENSEKEPHLGFFEILPQLWKIQSELTLPNRDPALFAHFADSFIELESLFTNCPNMNSAQVSNAIEAISKKIEFAYEKILQENPNLLNGEM